MRDHWGNPTSPEQPKDESFASALDRYASAFRVLAVLGAIGLVIVSVPAGEGCTDTVLNTCVERGWTVTSVVIALWASAVGLLIQAFWAALMSNPLAVLLRRGAARDEASS